MSYQLIIKCSVKCVFIRPNCNQTFCAKTFASHVIPIKSIKWNNSGRMNIIDSNNFAWLANWSNIRCGEISFSSRSREWSYNWIRIKWFSMHIWMFYRWFFIWLIKISNKSQCRSFWKSGCCWYWQCSNSKSSSFNKFI